MNGQAMLVEVRLDDGSWPRDRTNKKRKTSVKEKLLEGAALTLVHRCLWSVGGTH